MDIFLDILLLVISWIHVWNAPYTKVEESFNLHAVHDVYFYGSGPKSLSNYDHFTFPGVVPRSFVGSVILGWALSVSDIVTRKLGFLGPKLSLQITLRLILAAANVYGLRRLRQAITRRFGVQTGALFTLFTCSQFHLPYWMSRTLPNMFAILPVNIALACLVDLKYEPALALATMTATSVILRAELVILAGFSALTLAWLRHLPLVRVLRVGVASGFIALCVTVAVDSYFWKTWLLWPELQGIIFNVVEGKSSEWGVSPFHVYFTQHLPKLLLGAAPFAFLGLAVDKRLRTLAIPSIAYTVALSALGHKEWRFIIYVVPVFNLCAAHGAQFFWNLQWNPSWVTKIARLGIIGILLLNCAITILLAKISALNYPGGQALNIINQLRGKQMIANVHICNLAAQTGASLFLQEHSSPYLTHQSFELSNDWIYTKDETFNPEQNFDYAIVERESDIGPWRVLETVDGFASLNKNGIVTEPKLWLIAKPL